MASSCVTTVAALSDLNNNDIRLEIPNKQFYGTYLMPEGSEKYVDSSSPSGKIAPFDAKY
jgi:hypothetical protein